MRRWCLREIKRAFTEVVIVLWRSDRLWSSWLTSDAYYCFPREKQPCSLLVPVLRLLCFQNNGRSKGFMAQNYLVSGLGFPHFYCFLPTSGSFRRRILPLCRPFSPQYSPWSGSKISVAIAPHIFEARAALWSCILACWTRYTLLDPSIDTDSSPGTPYKLTPCIPQNLYFVLQS